MNAPTNLAALPWLDHGFTFLTGFPEELRRRTVLMPIQVFVDESQGHTAEHRCFGMVGLRSTAEKWLRFSDEWAATLKQEPSIHHFKMSDAAKLGGEFHRHGNGGLWTEAERDQKVAALARVINKHVENAVFMGIQLEAHERTWKKMPKPLNDPYFWPFHVMVWSACFDLWELGIRDKFEIIFDENKIYGTRARAFFEHMKILAEQKMGPPSALFPTDILFRDDKIVLPLQAADLLVGCVRRYAEGDASFAWVDSHLTNVIWSGRGDLYSEKLMAYLARNSIPLPSDFSWPEASS
jgi:hypothetical protein